MPAPRAVSGPIARAASGPLVRAASGPIERVPSGPVNVPERSSLDALLELDAPGRSSAGDADKDTDAAADADDESPFVDAKAEQSRPERLVALPPPEPARSAEEQLEQRRARVIERIATVRDALRLLSGVGVADEPRKAVTQALLELQTALGGAAPASVLKDPKASLAAAGKETLDAAEPLLGAIEDKLLALDEQIDEPVFEARAPSAAPNKKVLARYGRLLASRRMPVGARRNRFEWLATQLLTRTNAQGQLLVAPPERARTALRHLIGDLPRKLRQEEVDQAAEYLYDAGKRLDGLESADELFESGLYADVHGYKVSMREHLLSPEVVYRTVLFQAKLHNRLEGWIEAQAREHPGDEQHTPSALREQLRSRLLAERDDVDGRLGAKPKLAPLPAPPNAPAPAASPPPHKRAAKARSAETDDRKRRIRVALDRGILIGVAALIVVAAAAYVVRERTGLSSEATSRKLTSEEMPALSPLLVAGNLRTLGADQALHGWISGTRWRALDPAARRTAADELARRLSTAGIERAELYDHQTLVIAIEHGGVVSAAGAAP